MSSEESCSITDGHGDVNGFSPVTGARCAAISKTI